MWFRVAKYITSKDCTRVLICFTHLLKSNKMAVRLFTGKHLTFIEKTINILVRQDSTLLHSTLQFILNSKKKWNAEDDVIASLKYWDIVGVTTSGPEGLSCNLLKPFLTVTIRECKVTAMDFAKDRQTPRNENYACFGVHNRVRWLDGWNKVTDGKLNWNEIQKWSTSRASFLL